MARPGGPGTVAVIERSGLGALMAALAVHGRLLAPTVREGAVVHAEITSDAELPVGWVDEQEPGEYRLRRTLSPLVFNAGVGPQSFKPQLFPAESSPLEESCLDGAWRFVAADRPERPPVLLGVRACDLAAIAVQDRVLLEGAHPDAVYAAQREDAFIVAVNCTRAGGTCFCVSMGCGPRATSGFDLALTELLDSAGHRFLAEPGTERGARVLDEVPTRPATQADLRAAGEAVSGAAAHMGRRLDTEGIRELLQDNWEHPRWNDVADRCLSCGNCTQVCPTCFCTTVDEVGELSGERATRRRRWDSCFALSHSYIHGGSVRASTRARYRQWMTHKLSTWIDQFGTSGCVGCGRCITWCPVGIDITEEAAAIRATAAPREARL